MLDIHAAIDQAVAASAHPSAPALAATALGKRDSLLKAETTWTCAQLLPTGTDNDEVQGGGGGGEEV